MIDEQLIQSAQNIRKTFLRLNKDISAYQSEIGEMVSFLQQKLQYLENYNITKVKDIKSKVDISEVTKDIISQIDEIELAEKKIQNKIVVINDELEKLKKDEEILYKTIKERYPELNDDQIIKEIQQNLKN